MELGMWIAVVVYAAAGTVNFVALLILCAYVVKKASPKNGLADLATVVAAWRKDSIISRVIDVISKSGIGTDNRS